MSFSSPTPPMQASKWLALQVLIDDEEMESLCGALAPFAIYRTGAVVPIGEEKISLKLFLDYYSRYVQSLKHGQIPLAQEFYPYFTTVFTISPETIFCQPVGNDKHILRLSKPCLQLQMHTFDYSPYDGKFRSMIFGVNSVLWGIQFSYPQLYRHPITQEILNSGKQAEFPNASLFKSLQRWLRQHTIPTPFQVDGRATNAPMRLGKQCLVWINQHPQLQMKNIKVVI